MMVAETKDNPLLYERCLNRVLESDNDDLRFYFLKISTCEVNTVEDETLVESLYQNRDDFFYSQEVCFGKLEEPLLLKSKLPSFLAKTRMYDDLMKKYFSLFFMAEKYKKMDLVASLNYMGKKY